MDFEAGYDVVVTGGGIAGVAAALQAARSGKKTVLVEKTVLLGGLATTGLVYIYLPLCDGNGHQVTFGICEELIRLSLKYGPGEIPESWKTGADLTEVKRYRCVFSPAAFMLALDEVLEEAGVDIWLDSLVCGVEKDAENHLTGIIVENKSGRGVIRGRRFIDASGDCEVARKGGAPCAASDNFLSVWALQYHKDAAALSPGVGMYVGGCSAGGHPLDAETIARRGLAESDLKIEPGISGRKVTDFVLNGRRLLREHYRRAHEEGGFDRNNLYALKLPAMPQFRKIYCIDGAYVLQPGENQKCFDDSIGMVGDWRKAGPVWEIPYRTLYPENGPFGLLAAGRCTAACGDAWEITRVIPTAAMTGQVAGLAAAMSLDAGVDPSGLDVKCLQGELRSLGFKLHLPEAGLEYV